MTRERVRTKWWLGVSLAVVALLVNVSWPFTYSAFGTSAAGLTSPTNVLWALVLLTLVQSSVAIHFDRKYVSSVSDWTPSRVYYFTFLGYVGMIIAAVYLWRRHRILGIP